MSTSIFELKMIGLDKKVNAKETTHILDSMKKGGIEIAPNGCHGGGCGVCKIKLLRGDVITSYMSKKHISEFEKEEGFVLACRTYPKSNIEFEFVGKSLCKNNKKYGLV